MSKEIKIKNLKNKKLIILIIAIILIGIIIGGILVRNVIVNKQTAEEKYNLGENTNSSLIAKYIRKGVKIGGITGTLEVLDTSDATAKPEDILEGKTAYVNGEKITGTMKEWVEFNSGYGRIEIVWLDKNNNIIDNPISPKDSLQGMMPIKWNGTEFVEADENNSGNDWYEYKGKDGTEDNRESKWANAKDSKGSYFVWVPRYAYRIVYYASEDSDVVSGYCDGRGMVDVLGNKKYELDSGVEVVEKDGNSYIVHPAFETNLDLGGLDKDLDGIWVAKYEASGTKGTDEVSNDLKVVPGVSSLRYQTIGAQYTSAYNYDRNKESHLIKNSEWGAVAYLTHSQYGRNGHEIDINNSNNMITGNGGGSVDADPASGTTNAYNTDLGQKASSTGNIYGIYDLSGGTWERTAAFDTKSNNLANGNNFASTGAGSTKYATAYENGTDVTNGEKVYEVGKIGDATKETYTGIGEIAWNNDGFKIPYQAGPFFLRGLDCNGNVESGIFASSFSNGASNYYFGIRIILSGSTL